MDWIKFEDKVPNDDSNICVLIYEDWNRRRDGSVRNSIGHNEAWITCGGYYSRYEWYIPCNDGVEGGVCGIYTDYDEGQYIRAVAWCPMPDEQEIR